MEDSHKDREFLMKNLKEVITNEDEILIAYLYGSYTYGSVFPWSDIDVAIYLKPSGIKKYLEIEKRILSALIDKIHSDRIDLRILNVLPLLHQYYVLKDGIPIFIRDDRARADFETWVMIRFFELKPYLEEYRELFLSRIKKRG